MLVWTSWLTLLFSADPTIMPLLVTLPEDGHWAKYDLRVQMGSQDHLVAYTVRSVGQFQQAGKDVRCIETELIGNAEIPSTVHRFLVPNDAFGPDKFALGQIVRMWVRKGTDPVETYNDLSGDEITRLFQSGITQELKKQDAKEAIGWQRGKLECTVYTGKSSPEIGTTKFHNEWTIQRHDEVPFGLAGLRLKISPEGQDNVLNVTLTLQDFGKDAKASLPDYTP
jgi:hypothetical protein